jgi:hypothetical protein
VLGFSFRGRVVGTWTLAVLLLAGCATPSAPQGSAAVTSADPNAPRSLADAPGHVTGRVVDPELVPIEGADVVITPGDHAMPTSPLGTFEVGPLEPGEYTVHAEKKGYQSADVKTTVVQDKPSHVVLTLVPTASDVPYHESLNRVMYMQCAFAIYVTGVVGLVSGCGFLVDYGLKTATGQHYTNTIDNNTFPFKIQQPGFRSLVMEMTWPPQQFGTNGLMQLTEFAKASASTGGVGVAGTVYGGSMAQPYHDLIHAGKSYRTTGGKPVIFYPNANETASFEMLISGYYGNTSVPQGGSAVFYNYKPSVWLTFFYNREASYAFTILPDK